MYPEKTEATAVGGFTTSSEVIVKLTGMLDLTDGESRLLRDYADWFLSPEEDEQEPEELDQLREQIGYHTAGFIEGLIDDYIYLSLRLLKQLDDVGLKAGVRPEEDESGTFYQSDIPTSEGQLAGIFDAKSRDSLLRGLRNARAEDQEVRESGSLET